MKCVFTILFVWLCLSNTARGQSISQLFAFACSSSNCPDGTKPNSVIQASDGNLYGTMDGPGGGGIFKLTEAGKITVLYPFKTNSKTGFYDQGYSPAGLAEGPDGFLYGVNSAGGPNSASSGTVFKISKTGTGFQVLETFCTSCTTGAAPVGPFLQATDGNLWNTSYVGGSSGLGLVFSITPSGGIVEELSLTPAVGVSPIGGVLQATDGTLFGAASADGTAPPGETASGTVYKITGLPAKR